jgi:hypothetical protein
MIKLPQSFHSPLFALDARRLKLRRQQLVDKLSCHASTTSQFSATKPGCSDNPMMCLIEKFLIVNHRASSNANTADGILHFLDTCGTVQGTTRKDFVPTLRKDKQPLFIFPKIPHSTTFSRNIYVENIFRYSGKINKTCLTQA